MTLVTTSFSVSALVEQNIIINSHLMMNVFSKGVASPETVEAFLDKIPFKKIEAHLKN